MTAADMVLAAPFRSDAEVEAVGLRLIDRTLPKAEWTHAAHLAAAAGIIAIRPDLDAARDMPGIIRAYNEATGVPNSDTRGYHDTITQASLRAARAFLAGQPAGTPLHLACNGLLASRYGDKRWPLLHWTEALLFSSTARRASRRCRSERGAVPGAASRAARGHDHGCRRAALLRVGVAGLGRPPGRAV